ncbi:MAG: glycine--tRNA ligase subunit beta [Proteobacteria bacterium]|nr:glycine--tRNA ligase subunit beta [Pseudomonadota bacterium]
MLAQDFLFELGVEEMPPKALETLSTALSEHLLKSLAAAGIAHGPARRFATPRRLAVLISDLADRQPDRPMERRGPPLSNAFDAQGAPTQAALAFARSCGVEVGRLEHWKTDKGAWLRFSGTERGAQTAALLPDFVAQALAALPIPKRMRWGANTAEFVRPVHWVLMLYGEAVLPARILGLDAGRITYGHRFHAPKPLSLARPADYESALYKAKVIADSAQRRELIRRRVKKLATELSALDSPPTEAAPYRALIDEDLLEEVTALVEWPVPIAGRFEERFLSLPREVVISTVQHHQRYFPVQSASGELTRHFITVSNIRSRDSEQVRLGNERVVRPRLSDAAFFWDQDRKQTLAQLAAKLDRVTFQTRLGSYAQKTERVAALTALLAPALDVGGAARVAAPLCKADLLTAMVNEFPELQGIMGRYYALAEGLPADVATALEEQYLPRFAADRLPQTRAGQALALADRIDTLTGIFAIDQKPTGAKDPFGLRRAALGILRILLAAKLDIDLAALLATAAANQPVQREAAARESHAFLMDRLRGLYIERGENFANEMLDAVLASDARSPVDIEARLLALRDFLKQPDAANLAAANKRIANLLRKTEVADGVRADPALFNSDAERALHAAIERIREPVEHALAGKRYREALKSLTSLRSSVDAFFDGVMVMDENAVLRNNRLAMLKDLSTLFGGVANLSHLPG